MKRSEKDYMNRVAELGCICCAQLGHEPGPTQLHHIREGQGMSQRASNWLVIPLCPECHTGRNGVHGTKAIMRLLNMTELDLLAATIEAMNGH